ncbi:GUN4 domain-containing protein [Microcoleus sp. FACHB-68]|uniref:GUN4 domain-containing protein n=1 Tax=Microcoleus sp. FACHB-68 TaxID=2692826 RepID=UPI0016828BE4|nr:GUN4 domain-containing protein [Microcoleus sp. FACHB-68]MBD1938308.1 GUN4 N-terminal ARM-like repeat domain-containing protein [Microcoleus sp. FACHB-68]
MIDSTTSSAPNASMDITGFGSQLRSAPEKTQLQLIQQLADPSEAGLDILMEFLIERRSGPATVAIGKAYQMLFQSDSPKAAEFLNTHFPTGVVPLRSERGIDYLPLQKMLAAQDFQEADRLTLQLMCELAGASALQRKWLYFTEVDNFPIPDLQTLDYLWGVYSEGKFGFSVQREIWLSVGKNWDKLWPKINWKAGNNWTRYPQGFTWDLSAPKGHLPLTNQLRGVRVMEKLLTHPAWEARPN